jgi:hypothetical protein
MMVAFITPPAWGLFTIGNISVQKTEYRLGTVQVQLCNKGTDKYPFGFNTQEKVNEIAGIGNHNTALFWEYDTRLGRRWNLDPVDQVSISNYAVNKNNPIWYLDRLGDNSKVTSQKIDDKVTEVNISSNIYVVGENSKSEAESYQKTFDAAKGRGEMNGSVEVNGHTFNMSLNIKFVDGKNEDIERLESEVKLGKLSGDSYIKLDKSGPSKVVGLDFPSPENSRHRIVAPILRANINVNTARSTTGLHETLHLTLGLQDKYSQRTFKSHDGHERNWMGMGELGRTEINTIQWKNVMNSILEKGLLNGGVIKNYTEKP